MSKRAAISERSVGQSSLIVEENDEFIVIRGVRVLNEVSRNGGRYSRRARESAARLANRLPLAVEHTTEDAQRRYTDRVGQLREGRMTTDGMVEADMHVNKGHARAQQIAIDARHMPENICLSIELPPDGWIGEDRRHDNAGYAVEDITAMDDCCIVARGGTTNTLYESFQPHEDEDEDDMATNSDPKISTAAINETIKKSISEHEERRKVESHIDSLTRANEDLKAQNGKLQEQIDALKAADERRKKAVKICEQAKELGAGQISESYAATLAKLDDEEVQGVLKERAEMLKKAGGETNSTESGKGSFDGPSVGGANEESDDDYSWLKRL